MQLPSADTDLDVEAADVTNSVSPVATRPKERRAPRRRVPSRSVTPGVDCNKARPPERECSVCLEDAVEAECPETCQAAGQGFNEPELDSSLSQCAGADCRSSEST